ncbi:MAG TPA: hypothetical protein VG895_01670 [Patescibacteria group bacterium]|nr:hypothetical protein [Patescibacteria group bacterium]
MHAYLIIGDSSDFINSFEGRKINFVINKIADVRELKATTKLKLTEKTVIVLERFDEATAEAQNAFLKSLEEPQINLTYVLTAQNILNILPTIVSRCEVKEFESSGPNFSEEEKEKMENFIKANDGQKIKQVSLINKREEAIEFIRNLIFSASESKIESYKLIDEANKTLNALEKNGNVQLQLTNFVVNSRI